MADIATMATALVAKFTAEVLPAATGAAVSMKFLPTTLSHGQRFTSAIAAYAIGTYVGRGLCEYLHISSPRAVDAIVFGIALFGMSFVGTAMSEMKPIIQALRRKWVGGTDEEK